MKRVVLALVAMMVMSATAAVAQNVMVVDSEKVFKSIAAYGKAIEEVDSMAKKYQTQVDDAFNELEKMFNDYQNKKSTMSAYDRQQSEQRVVKREEEITAFQESIFGEEGVVLKKRVELIKPIQDKVFGAIEKYAADKGFDLVIDIASNANILYHKPTANHTDAIIAIVK